jgi:hypothetical protein
MTKGGHQTPLYFGHLSIDIDDFWYISTLRGFRMIYSVKIFLTIFGALAAAIFLLKMRFWENRQKSLLKHKKSPQNGQKCSKMPQFISFFNFINHFGKYIKIRNKYMKKCHFVGKIQILTYFLKMSLT